jgi:hypothetical protein
VRYLTRWPFLIGAVVSFAAAVDLLNDNPTGRESAAAALLVAGSVMLGAFIVLMDRSEPGD